MASESVKKFIRKRFQDLIHQTGGSVIVEKTCANSLRLPFVRAVLPNAKFIFIYRNGLDAIGSAKLRWSAKLDIKYILRKAKFIPKSDLPFYAAKYIFNRLYLLLSSEKRLASWGPVFDGMQIAQQRRSLHEICALQWQECVSEADLFLKQLPSELVYRIEYEDFVERPELHIERLSEFLGVEASRKEINSIAASVSPISIGKGRRTLSPTEAEDILRVIGKSL